MNVGHHGVPWKPKLNNPAKMETSLRPTSTNRATGLIPKLGRIALLTAGLSALPAVGASSADTITQEEAHAIGVDAYIYFYPLLSMDVTRKQLTNVEARRGVAQRSAEYGSTTPSSFPRRI